MHTRILERERNSLFKNGNTKHQRKIRFDVILKSIQQSYINIMSERLDDMHKDDLYGESLSPSLSISPFYHIQG